MTTDEPTRQRERFTAFYEASYLDVLRFVARRAGRDAAEDLAHETFAIAWRRWADVPADLDGARAWTFTVARNLLLAARRRSAAGEIPVELEHIEPALDPHVAGDQEHWTTRLAIAQAWPQLTPAHQEAIALTVWEGLDAESAGRILGVSAAAFRVRLHRARRQLREAIDAAITAPEPALTAKDAR